MAYEIPDGAIPSTVIIVIYSSISLALSLVLFWMQHKHAERWSYVALLALSISFSTTASIIQQIHEGVTFRDVQYYSWSKARAHTDDAALLASPLLNTFNITMYWIQIYAYNVDSLLIMFWAMALVKNVYNIRINWVDTNIRYLNLASKIWCLFMPGLFVGLGFVPVLRNYDLTSVLLHLVPMLLGLSVGSVCIVMILVKYIRSRQQFATIAESSLQSDVDHAASKRHRSLARKSRNMDVDKWLVIRFTIAFVVLSIFEIVVLLFAWARTNQARALARHDAPDYSVTAAITNACQFVPAVTAGFLAFLIFGTTGPFRKIYAARFRSLRSCVWRRKPSERTNSETQMWQPTAFKSRPTSKISERDGAEASGSDIEKASPLVDSPLAADFSLQQEDGDMQLERRRPSSAGALL